HRDPRTPQDIPAQDLVHQRVEPSSGIGLGRPVQRVLQGTHLVQRRTSAVGGTSRIGTHRAPPSTPPPIHQPVAPPSPPVMCSGGTDPCHGLARPASGWLPLPGSPRVIGRRAPTVFPQPAGPGRAPPFPAVTIRTFRAPYAGESFAAALPGSTPLPWPSPYAP